MIATWFLLVGALLLFMGIAISVLRRLPVSTAMLYLLAGYALGPAGADLLHFAPLDNAPLLELIAEIAVLISLFAVGLKMRSPWRHVVWRLSLRLGVVAMVMTIALTALAGMLVLGLPLGAAVLLGAIIAPTDPVLASEVQLHNAEDSDRLRASLTGEGGLNDGIAFPFVMLGLGLLGLHELGDSGGRWFGVDLIWAIAAGLLSGWALGRGISRLIIALRDRYHEAIGLEEFVTLGLIGLAYGFALLIESYGFLAVFAAGVAMRHRERDASGDASPSAIFKVNAPVSAENVAIDPATAPAHMAETVLHFNNQLERIAEVVVVVLLGSMLSADIFTAQVFLLGAIVFLIVRPLSVVIALAGAHVSSGQRSLTAWLGIRGVGSIYYLMYAINHDLPLPLTERFVSLVLGVVALSIVLHGVSATPLMARYRRRPGVRDC